MAEVVGEDLASERERGSEEGRYDVVALGHGAGTFLEEKCYEGLAIDVEGGDTARLESADDVRGRQRAPRVRREVKFVGTLGGQNIRVRDSINIRHKDFKLKRKLWQSAGAKIGKGGETGKDWEIRCNFASRKHKHF